MPSQVSIDRIQQMYIAYYGRPADPDGLEYWADRLDEAGGSLEAIVNSFGTSAEFTERYGDLGFADLVNNLYQQAFDRSPEQDGLDFYVDRLNKNEASLADIAVQILDGAQNDHLAIISNKLSVAAAFTAKVEEENLDYSGNEAAEAAKAILGGVTADPASVTSVINDIDSTLADVLPPAGSDDGEGDSGSGGGGGGGAGGGAGGGGGGQVPEAIVVSLDIAAADENVDTAAADVVVGTLSASNIDSPNYAIVGGNASGVFQITGDKLQIKQGASLDHETAGSFTLTISADNGQSAGQTAITVTITDVDEAPTAIGLSAASAAEEAGTVAIGTISVTDEDDPNSSFGKYTYSTDDARFQFNNETGALSFVPGNGDLDFETEPSVTVRVTAQNGNGQSIAENFIITVTDGDDEPTAISLSAANTDENTTGVTIGVVSVADVDVLASFNTYTYATDDARFSVDNATGALTANTALNHEAAETVDVQVTATSSGGEVISKTFTINVADKNEAPTEIALSANAVAENAVAADIGAITVTDPDDAASGFATYTYSTDDARFEVSGTTLKLRDGVSLDFETEATVDVQVTATSNDGDVIAKTFTINVTDLTEGSLADGYIRGATVFRDANADGIFQEDVEISATTDDKGDFVIEDGPGDLIAFGGIDISTGLPFTGQFSAPADSDVINPLTTLVKAVADSGDANAEATVKAALGINDVVDLNTYDPLAAAANADDATSANLAVEVMAAAAQVANVLEQAAVVVEAAIADTDVVDKEAAFEAAATALASTISDATGTVDLDDATVVSSVVVGTATEVAEQTDDATFDDSTFENTVAAVAETAAAVIANVNAEVTEAVTNFGDSEDALAAVIEVAQVQRTVKEEAGVQQQLENAVKVVDAAVEDGNDASAGLASVTQIAESFADEAFEADQSDATVNVVVNEIRGTVQEILTFSEDAFNAVVNYNASPEVDSPVPIIVEDDGAAITAAILAGDFDEGRLAEVSAIFVESGVLTGDAETLSNLPSLSTLSTGDISGSIQLSDSGENIRDANLF